jgi:hypothetical protein
MLKTLVGTEESCIGSLACMFKTYAVSERAVGFMA